MVMRILNHEKALAASGSATEEGRRPTIVAGPEAASPELLTRPRRRNFKARDNLRILAEVDAARGTLGGVGAFAALNPIARGPKIAPPNPLAAEHARLLRDNKCLTQRLERAEAIIDLQKKVAALLGLPIASNEGS